MNQSFGPGTRLTLIGRVQAAGGDSAWAEFHAIYFPIITRWCSLRGLQPADAQDVSQQVFLKLLAGICKYCPRQGRFRAWLRTVVNHAVIDMVRATPNWHHLHQSGELEALASAEARESLAAEVEDADPGLVDVALELADAVVARVKARVKPHTWDMYYQVVVLGRSPADVAADHDVGTGTVHVVCHRVRKMLDEERDHLTQPVLPVTHAAPTG